MNTFMNHSLQSHLKWPGTALAAGMATVSLLWLMHYLISAPQLTLPEIIEYRMPNVVLVDREPPPIERANPVERPKPPEVLPKVPKVDFEIAESDLNIAPIVVAKAPVERAPMAYGARGPIPLMIAPVDYPRGALSRGTEGFVELEFDVNATGMPENIRVVRSEPAGVFDKSAMRALTKSKFSPVMKDGQPVPFHNLRHRFIFEMAAQA